MSGISARAYEFLYTEPVKELADLKHKRVKVYRTKTVQAGKMMYCKAYPLWYTRSDVKAASSDKKTRDAQRRLNDRNAMERTLYRAHATFAEKDLYITLTYEGGEQEHVPGIEKAQNDMQNYIWRIRAWRRKHGLPELQYIYVIEFDDGSGEAKRIHHHLLMSGMDRDIAEALWGLGRAEARKLQPDESGFEGVIRYMYKAKPSCRRVRCSRNIAEPKVTISDRKISRRRVERLTENFPGHAKEIFESLYPQYTFVEVDVRRSDYVSGVYVHGKMRKRE